MQMSVCEDAKVLNKGAQCLRITSRAIAKSISARDQINTAESNFPEIKTTFWHLRESPSLAPSRRKSDDERKSACALTKGNNAPQLRKWQIIDFAVSIRKFA